MTAMKIFPKLSKISKTVKNLEKYYKFQK